MEGSDAGEKVPCLEWQEESGTTTRRGVKKKPRILHTHHIHADHLPSSRTVNPTMALCSHGTEIKPVFLEGFCSPMSSALHTAGLL